MEVIQRLHKCALVVALIAIHEILCVQGRQLRPTNDQDFSKLTSTPTAAAEKKQYFQVTPQDHNIPSISTADHDSAPELGQEDAFQPAPKTPGEGPGIGHSYAFRPVPTTPGKGPGNGHAYAFRPAPTTPGKGHGHAYAFRPVPTTPGKGHGHAYAFRPVPTTPGKGHGHAYAFRPATTTPGKGPANGYSYANENKEVEAKGANYNGRHSTTGAKDDFRPTSPGHSPGVGHGTGKNAQPNA